MALFTGLEHFFEERLSLMRQARTHSHSNNINILEHFGRRLQDAFDVLHIFKSRCEELINIISDVISQTEMLLNCSEDALSIDRQYVCSCSKQIQFAWIKLLAIVPVTWDDRDVILRKKNSKDYLISTIPAQKLHQHLVIQKEH